MNETPRGRVPYKWIALSVTTIGALMAAIDNTIVILALPEMMKELHADMVEMTWVVMGYLLVSTILFLTFGRVADMFGRVRLYNLGFLVFTVGSLLCGLENSAGHLILFRLVQGIGASLLIVNSIAIITEAFPPEQRGLGLGFNSVTWATGSVLGPILGGLILNVASWRWIFFINVPIGIVGILWGCRALREISVRKENESFDIPGSLTFSAGLVSILLFLTMGIQHGWGSPAMLALLGISVAMFALFYARERRAGCPVLDLTLFESRAFNFAVLAATLQSLAVFSVNFLMVFYLIGVRNYSPLTSALLLIPYPVMLAVAAPLSGRLSDRIGARIPTTAGLAIQCAGLLILTRINQSTDYLHLAAILAVLGLGGGMFFAPNTSAAMGAAPQYRLGVASGALFTLRQSGVVTSYALSLAVAAASVPRDVMLKMFVGTTVSLGPEIAGEFLTGMRNAFYVSTALCFAAAILSSVRGSSRTENHSAAPHS